MQEWLDFVDFGAKSPSSTSLSDWVEKGVLGGENT